VAASPTTRSGRTVGPATPLRALGIGFGVVTIGALIGGVSHQIIGSSLAVGIAIDSLLTAVGFGVIVYSLTVE